MTGTLHRRHFAFKRGEYWLVLDEIATSHAGKKLDWQFHSPLSLSETPFGIASTETSGVQLILPVSEQDGVERIHRIGSAGLNELPGEPVSREIDWITFRKTRTSDPLDDKMAVLIYPTTTESPIEPPVLRWHRDPLDSGLVKCRVILADGEDLHFFSDGTFRDFGLVAGDFTHGEVA